jgi:CAAX protease family protein
MSLGFPTAPANSLPCAGEKWFHRGAMPWDFGAILAVLGILVPWRGAVRMRKLLAQPQLSSADRLALYASTMAFQWLAAGVVLWRALARQIAPADLALSLGNLRLTLGVAIPLAALLAVNQFFSIRRLAHLPPDRRGFLGDMARKIMPQNSIEQLVFFALVVTVSLCEEFLYRGFVQAVFQATVAASVLAGVIASAAFFSAAHFYQGKRGLLTTLFIGLVFALLRSWTGSLAPSMLAHFTADLSAGFAAPRFFNVEAQQSNSTAANSTPESSRGPAGSS